MMDCFSCGRGMTMMASGYFGYCPSCEVAEFLHPEPYICRTRAVTWQNYPLRGGYERIDYIDHSAEHWPSPA
jgi:hypothetical protein